MTAVAAEPAQVGGEVERAGSSGKPLGWWGMVSLIATEGMIFALLLFAYFYLRFNADRWPLGDIEPPELVRSGIRTALLLGSTIPMVVAERAIKHSNRRRALAGLALAWVMGALFLAGHVQEYVEISKEFTASTNAYGSAFYTITTLHAIHLVIGLVMVAYTWVRLLGGRYTAAAHVPLQVTAMYWHFVDSVWVAVFTSLYLSVRW